MKEGLYYIDLYDLPCKYFWINIKEKYPKNPIIFNYKDYTGNIINRTFLEHSIRYKEFLIKGHLISTDLSLIKLPYKELEQLYPEYFI